MGVEAIAESSVIIANVGMYFIISVAVIMIFDHYAAKKIGGKRMLGYKVLKLPKFISICFASAISLVIVLWCQFGGLEVKYTTLTYLGLPYFIMWVFFIVNVMRRVKAETKNRKNWL